MRPLNTLCETEWVEILRQIQIKHKKVCPYEK
jgi:hypothetical protein